MVNNAQIIIYQTESGQTKIEVRLEDETARLTQKLMAERFQTSRENITMHLKNIFQEHELEGFSVCEKSLHTPTDKGLK